MKHYTESAVPQTQSTKSSDSTNVSGDGILFILMLAVVAGIFLFKGKNSKGVSSPYTPAVTDSIPITGIPVIQKQQDFRELPFENGVNAPDLKSENRVPNTQCPMTNDNGCQRIIEELVSTKLSTLLAAPSGAGKSVTQAYWLTKLYEKFNLADVYVIARKNDSFNGLREQGKVHVYDPDFPKDALQTLQIVHDIFKLRSQYPEHERSQFSDKPVRLILADWYSIHNNLVKSHKKLWDTEVQSKLADIVTVAREFNVSLFADSQSFNLASLGLAEDSNIRNNLNIISQGLISIDEDGNEQGGFEVVQSIIRNPYVFPSEEVRRLINLEIEKLILISNSQHTPLILSTAGKPKVGLLPDLMEYKGKNIFDTQHRIKNVEQAIVEIESIGDSIPTFASAALPEPLCTIWRVAQEKQTWLSCRDIVRKEYAALKGKNTAEVVAIIQELERMGYVEVNNEGQAIRFRVSQSY